VEARYAFELAVGLLAVNLLAGLAMPSNVWADEITGTDGNDNLLGIKYPDTISELAGDDKIDSKDGKDQVNGNRGDDELHGVKSRI
jgi:Ca2+-binding RTX toxin-like protein